MDASFWINVGGYGFLAIMGVVILALIIRSNRGPKRLHDLAARLAAKHGGRVEKGRRGRPVVRIDRGALRYEIEWWRGYVSRRVQGPTTWITGSLPNRIDVEYDFAPGPEGRPGWTISAWPDGPIGGSDGSPTVTNLRVTIRGHSYDETEIEAALAHLDALARGS